MMCRPHVSIKESMTLNDLVTNASMCLFMQSTTQLKSGLSWFAKTTMNDMRKFT